MRDIEKEREKANDQLKPLLIKTRDFIYEEVYKLDLKQYQKHYLINSVFTALLALFIKTTVPEKDQYKFIENTLDIILKIVNRKEEQPND